MGKSTGDTDQISLKTTQIRCQSFRQQQVWVGRSGGQLGKNMAGARGQRGGGLWIFAGGNDGMCDPRTPPLRSMLVDHTFII